MSLAERISSDKGDVPHPVDHKTIMQYQQNNKSLIESTKSNKEYSKKHFHGVNKKYSLICRKHTTLIPKV